MFLTRHPHQGSTAWALDGKLLQPSADLAELLNAPASEFLERIQQSLTGQDAPQDLLPPIEPEQEVWASGVTYLSSRMAREAESQSKDVYQKVYDAERPELFFKATGVRVRGPGESIRIRADSRWDVPEPELTLAINRHAEIIGYTVGNDVSSRSIEGENPLYLPQAKVYSRSCAIGPGIRIAPSNTMGSLDIELRIFRDDQLAFSEKTSTSRIKRQLQDLVGYLYREMDFPHGAFLMTGTGIIPPEGFTLQSGDLVEIEIDGLTLSNPVE